ncbi:MAG: hypothetical protein GF398_10385 [Chitinivibrionales bacterium]|nr:hypothetical protein [Chitinivibrionales bacterium]
MSQALFEDARLRLEEAIRHTEISADAHALNRIGEGVFARGSKAYFTQKS